MFGKYDDFDYHVESAVQGGFAPDNGFTHIGFMVSWLIRHGLFRSEFLEGVAVADLASGVLRPNGLRDGIDGKLADDMLTPIGSAFLAACYRDYLEDYAETFAHLPDYGVPDDREHQAIADALIDRAFERWTTSGRLGRPGPSPKDGGLGD